MKNLHAKSPCCRGKIYRFGNRRRQCSICKKTWRTRQKKRGRKKKRVTNDFAVRYLNNQVPPSSALASLRNTNERKTQRQLEQSIDYFLKHISWPELPRQGSLVLIADAMVKYIEKSWHTFYFMLIKRANENEALIAKPYTQRGTENAQGWRRAIDSLPKPTRACIKAMVCDGHGGLTSYAFWTKWSIQRCNFHLIARIQSRRSKWKSGRHREEGQLVYDLVNQALTTTDEKVLDDCIMCIEEISWTSKSPGLRKVLSGFVKNHQDFRTYLYMPELNLPRTNNTAESLIGCVQNLNFRAKGFATLTSLTKRIHALIKHKKKIKCNGHFQPN
jgi:hypothetical protein